MTRSILSDVRWCLAAALILSLAWACGPKKAREPVTRQQASEEPAPPPAPPKLSETIEPDQPREESSELSGVEGSADILSKSLEAINAESPLIDINFEFDSAALSPEARLRLDSHARWLLARPTVTILMEGHCDERGTVEYNLALGDRRALSAYNYLLTLGVGAGRMKIISYGKEFPLDPGHNEEAWAKNRRCRFLITAK